MGVIKKNNKNKKNKMVIKTINRKRSLKNVFENYIGGDRWKFSDKIYSKLTDSNFYISKYNPNIRITVKELPNFIPNKNVFGLFWGTPTFKDVDSNYLLHLYSEKPIDYVISTSSGNTVEGMARAINNYNQQCKKYLEAILLVPEMSCYKVSKDMIDNNSFIKYVVLKNSTLDSIRAFATKLIAKMSISFEVICANANIKTAAYSQIGLALRDYNLINDDTCYVQTVSGGVGPAGFIEAAYKLKANPEILVVQSLNGKSTPIVDALNMHSLGKDPFSVFEKGNYKTSHLEPTLGSTRPEYAIQKFIKWRENDGRILPMRVNFEELHRNKKKILKALVESKIYPNMKIGLKLFDIEKSGFFAFVGALKSIKKIRSNNIVVNFTGRYPQNTSTFPSLPSPATPHIYYNPSNGIKNLLAQLKIKV